MSRLMSVAMTANAVIERRKTVTRRVNWWEDKNGRRLLKPGDTLTLCRKVQGRKPGEPIERLAEVQVVGVRREPLCAVAGPYVTGENGSTIWPEMIAEGFPDLDPHEFMRRYFHEPQGIGVMDTITRIEWRYLDEAEPDHATCENPHCDVVLCYCGNPALCDGTEQPPCGHHWFLCSAHAHVDCDDCRVDAAVERDHAYARDEGWT